MSLSTNNSIWWRAKRGVFGALVRISNRLFGREITHRSSLARWLNKVWLIWVETFSPARRRQASFERRNPDAPWFVPAAIECIESELRPNFVGFEWGCGRSTLWFAKRVKHITSVEGRKSWFDEISQKIANDGLSDRIALRLAEVTTEHGFVPEEVERYAGAIREITDGSLDFVVVDGHFREHCLRQAGKKLRDGGWLIVDNSEVVPKVLMDELKSADTREWNNGIWQTTLIRWSSNKAVVGDRSAA